MLERVLKDPILKSRRSDSGHTSALAFLRQVRGPEPGGVVVGGVGLGGIGVAELVYLLLGVAAVIAGGALWCNLPFGFPSPQG